MIPDLTETQLDHLQSSGEALFYRACREQLGDEIVVLYGQATIRSNSFGAPVTGDADFVIFDPNGGFLVVEVKGGGVTFDPTVRKWYSTDRFGVQHEIKDPFRQAQDQQHLILDQLRNHPQWLRRGGGRILAGHAVFLTHVGRVTDMVRPNGPPEIIGGRQHLDRLRQWWQSVVDFWRGSDPRWVTLGTAGMSLVEQLFCKPIDVRPMVSALLRDEEVVRIRLTEQQARVLRAVGMHRRAAISGGAGTGKSVLAVQKARLLAESGALTLLICVNRGLADHFKFVTEGITNLHAMTFHQLCEWRVGVVKAETGVDLLAEAQVDFPAADRFRVQLPHALALSTERSRDRYDAIIVDEGQDFPPEFWLPIECLLRDSKTSTLYVFFDHNQMLYQPIKELPIAEAPFLLTVNCRNTRHIHGAAYRFYNGVETDSPEIDGAPIEVITAPSREAQAQKVHAAIVRLIAEHAVTPEDIAVLYVGRDKKPYSHLQSRPLPKPVRWEEECHRQKGAVLLDTVSRFKGLEAAIVFLWGLDSIPPEDRCDLLYVGLSRAKSRVYLVGTEKTCAGLL
ncbi:MAG TPA: ATP-binding domain-containing protein [Kofleriaceae bacterium]|nr:ATP-binding domain-containing protein [Kofleriaceae bacterium]